MIPATLTLWLTSEGFPADGINSAGPNRTTPLMKASHQGNLEIVAQLLDAGADLQARNADGNNALWLACVGSSLMAIDLLAAQGIDIDNQNDNGATCLMYAASAGKEAVAARLLAAGANPKLQSLDGFTALDMASTIECLRLLIRAKS